MVPSSERNPGMGQSCLLTEGSTYQFIIVQVMRGNVIRPKKFVNNAQLKGIAFLILIKRREKG